MAMIPVLTQPAQALQYRVIPLGTLGGNQSFAYGINNTGQVVGDATLPGDTSGHAFMYDGIIHDLGTLGGSNSSAWAISNAGEVVGESALTGDRNSHAFLYTQRTMLDLSKPAERGSWALGVNDRGQVVGGGDVGSGAFLYNDGASVDLGTLAGYPDNTAYGINSTGQVVGIAQDSSYSVNRAWVYNNGVMKDLGTLGGSSAGADKINDRLQIVGWANTAGDAAKHAYLYDTTMHDLGTLPGYVNSYAFDINAIGTVVGAVEMASNARHAFVYDGTMHDLNGVVSSADGWTFTDALGINDSGWIAANATNPAIGGGRAQAFLLEPIVPEPASLAILGWGVIGLLVRRRR